MRIEINFTDNPIYKKGILIKLAEKVENGNFVSNCTIEITNLYDGIHHEVKSGILLDNELNKFLDMVDECEKL
ncbi:MAG: hypothetical protein V9F05_18085 [Chitinophagaceae bacterium]